ncbi:MAG TPA: hypothetical protein VGP51_05480, partial [Nocardioidaceae bacterium]|nr:hypothetical protein [Nocardioidaceae bacterium]
HLVGDVLDRLEGSVLGYLEVAREHRAFLLSLRIRGNEAVDLDDKVCPDGAALRTAVARVATDLVRDDLAGTRSYLLHCERSSGQYLFDSLLDAGDEFGVEADGFVPPGI